MAKKDDGHWMERATAKMKERGTLGSYGKASPKKISRDIKKGGKIERKALFARNVARASRKSAARKSERKSR